MYNKVRSKYEGNITVFTQEEAMRKLKQREISEFRNTVYSYFDEHERSLPWRETSDPYYILVSEIMLQQTQVNRVIGKYREFIKAFPTVTALHIAPQSEALAVWSGLGYNRRALSLKKAAAMIVEKFEGSLPSTVEELSSLPGIGHPTAAAIAAYAYNEPVAYIETNIRTVYIHHFFTDAESVSDKEILPLVEQTIDRENPRRWYSALMDYGVMLKASNPNPGRRSTHHVKQSKFEGSDRQIRGAVLRILTINSGMSEKELIAEIDREEDRCIQILSQLEVEGFLIRKNGSISLK